MYVFIILYDLLKDIAHTISWFRPFDIHPDVHPLGQRIPLGQRLGPGRHRTAAENCRGSLPLCGTTAVQRWPRGLKGPAEYGCKNEHG